MQCLLIICIVHCWTANKFAYHGWCNADYMHCNKKNRHVMCKVMININALTCHPRSWSSTTWWTTDSLAMVCSNHVSAHTRTQPSFTIKPHVSQICRNLRECSWRIYILSSLIAKVPPHSFHTGQVSLPCNLLLRTQLLYNLPLIINVTSLF